MSSSSSDHYTPPQNPSAGEPQLPPACITNEKRIESTTINPSSPAAPARATSLGEESTTARYSEMVHEFHDMTRSLGVSVLISAFIASFITTFLTLANDVIRKRGDLEFEIAMFFCILSASCHISDIVVSGRAFILAYQHSRMRFIDRPAIDDYQKQLDAFTRCLWVAHLVQGLGQALFGVALLYTLWIMLEHRILTSILYAFSSIVQVAMYFVGFWRISWAEDLIVPIVGLLLRLFDQRETREDD
ncbi:hypothetical protein AGABI1DRAFT_94618 [Agaricus bisporus var. burnettii JB137-S8]|uniref:Uncharacterized protein n=1 Tax=Agaricus bisporus var. burnettii (strain JB137-S8 / ATCC MYA-4627 / FGSC 10392) TaxID=597362 RepID=K5WZ03_AGABU|nr:uncharacterized protein AGABI1DRAFT_94618 [Agaricus bisporus var. burnettii JB137-S8]EKM75842.1 hypothetical protein AGABI1DRAFT_94618 [Agaricus bisporus var. burnettii JB137-S8]